MSSTHPTSSTVGFCPLLSFHNLHPPCCTCLVSCQLSSVALTPDPLLEKKENSLLRVVEVVSKQIVLLCLYYYFVLQYCQTKLLCQWVWNPVEDGIFKQDWPSAKTKDGKLCVCKCAPCDISMNKTRISLPASVAHLTLYYNLFTKTSRQNVVQTASTTFTA